jgi:TusA-related sulfurtransferase
MAVIIDRSLDLRGKICPYPTLEVRQTLQNMAVGQTLEVITDYYPAKQTIPNLMGELGYPCQLLDSEQPIFRFIIQRTR